MRLILLLGILGVMSCTKKEKETTTNLRKMSWLLGDWTRVNNKPGRTGWESWAQVSESEWRGESGTLQGTDTVFHEVTRIIVENDKLYFIADVPENTSPVRFEITGVTDSSFTCENPKHDFPQKIFYHFDGTRIHARVSAGEEGIDFEFDRITSR